MTARTLAVAALVLLLIFAMAEPPLTPSATASPGEHRGGVVGSPPPATGDWDVDEDTAVTDTDVVILGNITVRRGCSLELVGSNLTMRDAEAHSYVMALERGASLSVVRSSLAVDRLDAHEDSALAMRDGSISTTGDLLARCHVVDVDGSELVCMVPDSDVGEPGHDALMVLSGRSEGVLNDTTIIVEAGDAGRTSPGMNGSSGGTARLIANVTEWTGCQLNVRAGTAGGGGLSLPGVDGGDGGLGSSAEAVLLCVCMERTTISITGSSGGNGAGGADNNGGDAGDGGDGSQGGGARLSITGPTSLELYGCELNVESGDGGSGGNGGTAMNGNGGNGGVGADTGQAILELHSTDDVYIEGSTMLCQGGDGGYGGDFGRHEGTVGDEGLPKPGGDGGDSNVTILGLADFHIEGCKVTSKAGPGNDGGSGYNQGERGGDGGDGILRIRVEASLDAADVDLTVHGGSGGNGGPAISGISGNGGDGGNANLEFTGRSEMDVNRSEVFLYPGTGGKGNSVVWDGEPGLPDFDLETHYLVMRDCMLSHPLDDLADTARAHLYNCTVDYSLPVLPLEEAEAWTYFPVDIWVVTSADPSKSKPLVGYEVEIISSVTGEVVAIAVTDERGLVHVELPCFHYTSRAQEYMGRYYVRVKSPDGTTLREVWLILEWSILWPTPFTIVVTFPPKRLDVTIEQPVNGSTVHITPLNTTLDVVGNVVADDDDVLRITVNLTSLDDGTLNTTSIRLTKMAIPVSGLLIDDEKWNRFFWPEEYQNRWRFYCRFGVLGDTAAEYYVDGYYDITVVVATENRTVAVNRTVWLDITKDMVPMVSLTTPVESIDWNATGVLTLTGTAWDDTEVVRVELRIDGGAWTVVNGTTEWSYALDVRAMPDGFHTMYIRASDGSSESPEVSWSMSLDRTGDDGSGDDGDGRVIIIGATAVVLIVVLATVALVMLRRRRKGGNSG